MNEGSVGVLVNFVLDLLARKGKGRWYRVRTES